MEWAESLFIKNARLYSMLFEDTWKSGEKQARLLSKYFVKKGYQKSNVLDVPCGIGRISIPLAGVGFSVAGVDLSPFFRNRAKEKSTELDE
jgi:2-polyprenyl-3-methyl-5-hydroxy-6-metoxy-1,4-benzoquinol methylase